MTGCSKSSSDHAADEAANESDPSRTETARDEADEASRGDGGGTDPSPASSTDGDAGAGSDGDGETSDDEPGSSGSDGADSGIADDALGANETDGALSDGQAAGDSPDAGSSDDSEPNEDPRESGPSGAPREADASCLPHRDGSRLRRIGYLGEDGSWQADSWYDDEFESRCSFGMASDGVERCLPEQYGEASAAGVIYLDAACSERIFHASDDPCRAAIPPRYFTEYDRIDVECAAATYRVWSVGDRIVSNSAFRLNSDGTCTPVWTSDPADWPALYAFGEEIAPETFVAVESQEAVGERIQTVRRTTSDGAVDHAALGFDVDMNTTCYALRAGDAQWRCAPVPSTNLSYSDAACSEALASTKTTTCAMTSLELFGSQTVYPYSETGGCGSPELTHFYEPGDPDAAVTLTEAYRVNQGDNERCLGPYESTATVTPPGPAIPPEALLAGTRETAPCAPGRLGGSRLSALGTHWEDGSVFDVAFFDPEMDDICRVTLAEDGVPRCLPYGVGARSGGRFADAACTVPVASVGSALCPPDPNDPMPLDDYLWDRVDAPTAECQRSLLQVRRLVGPTLSVVYQEDDAGQCVVASDAASTQSLHRAIGEVIPAEEFVAFSGAP